jgi:methylated-DNA-[protein]-cysteine S-methyltransferase
MANAHTIYKSQLHYEDWLLNVAVTDKGLCYVQFTAGDYLHLEHWAALRFPDYDLVHDEEAVLPYIRQLIRYLEGGPWDFTISLDSRGTPFQLEVWKALTEIPFGETRSYSEIAEAIRRPNAIRAVGAAIGANPILIAVPCHRVIGKNGTLTGYRGGLEAKTLLLKLERKGAS